MKFEKFTFDVIVIGGGGAAALAVLAAKRAGAQVALITKESSLVGGATIMSAGGTSASFSPQDGEEVFHRDIMKAGGQLNDPRLVKIVAENSVNSLFNLETYDFLLDRKDSETLRTIKQGEGHTYARGYLDRREALGFCHALSRAVMRNEIAVFREMIVTAILMYDGRAVGAFSVSLVSGECAVFIAKAVILATGGLGALYEVTTNSAVLTGDGFAMAWEIGAELVDMEMVQFLPLAFPYPSVRRGKIIGMCSHFGPGVKLYNGRGERYMKRYDPERMEFTTRDIASRAGFTEIQEGRGTEKRAIVVDPRDHDPSILLRFKSSIPHIYAMFKDVYGSRVAEWQQPFEAIPSQHFFMGGLRIDEECRTNVPGLFAVGEVAGGVHGANRLSGVALTEIFVFGPRAGVSAALFAGKGCQIDFPEKQVNSEIERLKWLFKTGSGTRPFEIKAAIQKIMWDKLGPVRDEAGIKTAIDSLERLQRTELKHMVIGSENSLYNRDKMEATEVPLMLQTGLLVARSALERQESRGSHFRSDFPQRNDNAWLRNIIVKKAADNTIDIHTKRIDKSESKMRDLQV